MSVKATSSETPIAKAIVTPNEFMKRPTMPPMKATGRKTAIRERRLARTARPISRVPSTAACIGGRSFSSMKRKMFSSTITASSMTIPTTSVSASRVMMLRVKPMYCMAAKVAMSELGMAMAEMRVGRKRRRKNQTTPAAKSDAEDEVLLHRVHRGHDVLGLVAHDVEPVALRELGLRGVASRSFTRCTTSIVFVPDCLRTWRTTAGSPLTLASVSASSTPSSTRATSETRTGVPLRFVITMSPNASGCGDAAVGAQRQVAQALLDAAARELHVLRGEGPRHLGRGQAQAGELRGVGDHVDLAEAAADELAPGRRRSTDSIWRRSTLSQNSVTSRIGAGGRDRHREDGRGVGVDLLDHRRVGVAGQVAQHAVDAVAHLLGGHVGVLLQVEVDDDLGDALGRDRDQLVDAADRVDRLLDLVRDLGLDLLRRRAHEARC